MTETPTPHSRTVQPLQDVLCAIPSTQSGQELNPHYMWCVREFALHLACGHMLVLTRMAPAGPDPARLHRPLPTRLRCGQCPEQPSTGRPRRTPAPPPATDPVVGMIADELAEAYADMPDRALWVLEFGANYGGPIAEALTRQRGYAAMALRAAGEHLDHAAPESVNAHARQVYDALQAWRDEPTEAHRSAVRAARQRLYGSQLRHGNWYTNRALNGAAKLLSSPYPHNVDGAREILEFGPQRAFADRDMHRARDEHDQHLDASMLAVLVDDDTAAKIHGASAHVADEKLTALVESRKPIDPLLAEDMLLAYRRAVFGNPTDQ